MTAQLVREVLVTPEDYLDSELLSPVKHEYVAGVLYVMPEYTNRHNEIAGNTLAALRTRLRGQPCRPCNSDTKVRLRLPNELRFYYPDAQVTCHPNPPADSYQDNPMVVIEVISESKRRADKGEKRTGYWRRAKRRSRSSVQRDFAGNAGFCPSSPAPRIVAPRPRRANRHSPNPPNPFHKP